MSSNPNSVSAGIFTLVSFNKLSTRAVYTAKFITFFYDLFDVFNSKKLNKPIVLKRRLRRLKTGTLEIFQRSFNIFIRP